MNYTFSDIYRDKTGLWHRRRQWFGGDSALGGDQGSGSGIRYQDQELSALDNLDPLWSLMLKN